VKLYVDLETLDLIGGPGFRNPISALRFKRGDASLLEVMFLAGGVTPASIGDPSTLEIQFGIKPRGRYDVDYLCHTAAWTMPAPDAASPVYQCSPSFNTTELDSALGVGSSTGTELSEITLMGEITWREGAGAPTSTRTFYVVVENDVNRGTEGIPTSANSAYPAPDEIALLASVVRNDAVQPLSAAQRAQARTNIGLNGDPSHPTDIFNLRYSTGLTMAEWVLGAKMLTVGTSNPPITAKSSTGYAKVLRWDGAFGARSGTGVPSTEFTLTIGTAPISPYTSRSPKFLAVFPCDSAGTISGTLTSLTCAYCMLTALDVRGLSSLTSLNCGTNNIPWVDLSGLPALTYLDCSSNNLTALELAAVPLLTTLTCGSNALSSLDLGKVPLLTSLTCTGTGAFLTTLALTNVPLLSSLNCSNCKLITLDVTGLPLLTSLNCASCSLTSLVVRGLSALTTLDCGVNSLTALDVTGLSALNNFNGMSNILSPAAMDAMWLSLPSAADDNEGTWNMTGSGNQTSTSASLAKRNAMIEGGWTLMIN